MISNTKSIKTGNLFKSDAKTTPCTLRKPLEIVIKEIHGPYTELDRKLWNVLMYMACEELDDYSLQAKYHSVEERQIILLFSEHSGVRDLELIWKSLKRLVATTVNIEIEDEDCKIHEATNLINARIIENKKDRTGKIEFMFPPAIANLAKDPERFTRIRMHFMLGLKGKYSVSLYEILESKVNMGLEYYEWSLDELKVYMRVPKGKLVRWVDLKRFAIDPFVKEINKNSENAGFKVNYETVLGARKKVIALRFYLEKQIGRKLFEKNILKSKKINHNKIHEDTFFSTHLFEEIKKEMPGIDIYKLKAIWDDSIKKVAGPINNPEGHFRNFCRKVYRKSYLTDA